MYDNIYLEGHYPFDKLLRTIENIIADSIITEDELNYVKEVIDSLLNPVEVMKKEINSLENKIICLSGNFEYGEKKMLKNILLNMEEQLFQV